MQYLQPNLITIPTAVVLTCPDTAKPVLFTAEGPLVCAGEESGARYIITGFELFPFDGLRSPTVSIFTLNALRWLFQSGAAQSGEGALGAEANSIALDSSALVGTIALPNEVQSAAYVAPDTTTLANRPTRSLLVTKPGIVQLNHAGTDASAQTLLAVNALFHEESDISLTPTIALPEGETPPQASANTSAIATREKTHLEAILTLLLLIALTLDLIRRIVTRSRWGGLA
jgi:hypothetical protein